MSFKVTYKNGCTPKEQQSAGGRYYIDSDVGRKFGSTGTVNLSMTATGIYNNNFKVTNTAVEIVSADNNYTFVYIKNTNEQDILITLDDSNYLIMLSKGEAFASQISVNANVKVKADADESTDNSTIEYYVSK